MIESVDNESRRTTMQQIRIQITGPGRGPGQQGGPGILARILISIVAVVMLVAAAFLGAIFFLAALGVFVAGSLLLAVRIWWARRQIEKAMKQGDGAGMPPGGPGGRGRGREDVIEGEYLVVDDETRPERKAQGDAEGER
jgi:hypothetical protein